MDDPCRQRRSLLPSYFHATRLDREYPIPGTVCDRDFGALFVAYERNIRAYSRSDRYRPYVKRATVSYVRGNTGNEGDRGSNAEE